MVKKGSHVQWSTSRQINTGTVIDINERMIEITRNGVQITRMGKPNNRVLLIKQSNEIIVLKLEGEVSVLEAQTA